MSLLLKALENAAKNREAGNAGSEEPATPQGASELSLEPMAKKSNEPTVKSEPADKPDSAPESRAGLDRGNPANRTQAQNVLRAGSLRDAPPVASSGIVAWLARRPLVAFSTAAGLFAIGYGIYLYLQITNPGVFMARPVARAPGPAVSAPPPAPPPPNVAAPTASAPVAAVPAPAEPPQPASNVTAPAAPAPVATAATPASQPTLPATANPAGSPQQTSASATPAAPASAIATAAPAPGASPPSATVAPPKQPAAVVRSSGTTRAAAPARTPPASSGSAAPSAAQSELASAYQALQAGQIGDAERLYRQVLAADPRNIDALLGLASAQAQQNRADAATQAYMRVLELDPRNSYAQAGLLNIGGRADPAAAESRLKQLITREPSAYLYFTLGNLYAEQNQWAAAQGAYFQAFNLSPDNPDYAFNLAVGLEHLSQPKLALDYYRRAISLAQTRGSAQFALPAVQSRIRSLESALAERP